MRSPFRLHQIATRALMVAGVPSDGLAPAFDENSPAASEYQQLLAALHNDLRALHDIQSQEGKIDRKRLMITTYLPWVQGALDAGEDGRAVQDEIVVTMLVWALDTQDWELTLNIGGHVLEHGLSLPERYKRNAACVIAEEAAEAAKKDISAVPFDVLQRVAALIAGRDMPDQVRAKLQRAIGLNLMAQIDEFDPQAETATAGGKSALVDAALTALRSALTLNSSVGVKKQVEQLEREAKKLAEQAAPATTE